MSEKVSEPSVFIRFRGGFGKFSIITLFVLSVSFMPATFSSDIGSALFEVAIKVPGVVLPRSVKSIGLPFDFATATDEIAGLNLRVMM